LKQAYNLCRGLDEKDTIYIALAIELNGLLWTGDKKLINGLDKKDFNQTITSTKLFSSY
jgi:predicted nucleic acid-binding protein